MRPVVVEGMLLTLAVLMGMLLWIPAAAWTDGAWALLRYSFEYGVLVLVLGLAARSKAAGLVRRILVALYALLLLFLFYEHAAASFFRCEPAIVEDVRLLINLVHFLGEMTSWRWTVSFVSCVAGALAFLVLSERALARLQARLSRVRPRHLAFAGIVWALGGGVSIVLGGPIRIAGAKVVDNVRASIAVRRKFAELTTGRRDDRYDDLMKVRLAERPNVYLLVIEAYGQVLVTWDMTEAYRDLMGRVERRLAARGYHMRTAYSVAPVHGGKSWLSLATLQTGILIDQPEPFRAFERSSRRVPTLHGFFKSQGYHTASLEPGTKERIGVGGDAYGYDVRVCGPDLDYQGKRWGFGEIPDKYSLDTFNARFWPTVAEPRFLFYMAVTTHYPWSADTVPPYEPPGADWPPLGGVDAIGSEFRAYYFKSIEYEWRALTEWIEADASQNALIVVLGDHQPRLESNPPGEVSFEAPIHVLSKDGALVDAFGKYGFRPGLFLEPGRASPLVHEALFSLLVTELSARHGTADTKRFAKYFPEGIGLAGLNR
jgi:hypothetical protein